MLIRKSVKKFARKMEKILRENDYKGGQENCSYDYLVDKFEEERKELYHAYARSNREEFLREIIDCANCLMMLHDILTPQLFYSPYK